MILLDTNALLWLATGHRRAAPLRVYAGQLRVSPATLLELAYLIEVGSASVKGGVDRFRSDPRWDIDEISSVDWFEIAESIVWTREPFDRLIVAHAKRRKWRLATGDSKICDHLRASELIEL